MGFIIRILINSVAILFVANIVPGMQVNGMVAALGAGLVLGLVNAVVRPLLILLTLPLTVLTIGLFLFVLNAICLLLTSSLVKGFDVQGFLPALFGSLLISIVSGILTFFISDRGTIAVIKKKNAVDRGKVIDHRS